jgi:hypothetical protein
MGGKRIAEQVRRALIAAARTGTVVVAIDVSGWGCSTDCAEPYYPPAESGGGGGGGNLDTGGANGGGMHTGGRTNDADAGKDR